MTTYSLPSLVHTITDSQQRNNTAGALFSQALSTGQQRRWWAKLTRRPNGLRALPAAAGRGQGSHDAGRKQVALANIRGSEGRTQDFDDRFYPATRQTRQRWQSVASAIEDSVRLPPVDLIRVGNDYYVRDGHHRVSVAAAMGQDTIEATVTQWSGQR